MSKNPIKSFSTKAEIIVSSIPAGQKSFIAAHTCCNKLDLPIFNDYEVFKSAMLEAIEDTSYSMA